MRGSFQQKLLEQEIIGFNFLWKRFKMKVEMKSFNSDFNLDEI